MKNRRKNNRILLLLVLLLAVSIGFAALATTLKINGIAGIGRSNWSVYWNNVANQKGVQAETPEILPDEQNRPNTLVTWEVTLQEPGDYYEFTVDAVNAGSVDAMITKIEHKLNGADMTGNNVLPSYIKYSVTYADGMEIEENHLLPKAVSGTPTRETYKIRVEFDRDAVYPSTLNSEDATYELSFGVTYTQANENAIRKPVVLDAISWATIAANIESDPETYPLGSTKTVDIDIDGNGTIDQYEHFHARIVNTTTPEECSTEGFSQTSCGVVFDFVEVLTYHNMNPYDTSGQTVNQGNGVGNIGGWEHSQGRAFLNSKLYVRGDIDYSNGGIYSKLPTELKNVLADTYVVSNHNDTPTDNFITTDKLYLPATKEVYGKKGTQVLIPGDSSEPYTRQFDYYEKKGLSTNPDTYGPDKKKYKGYYSVWGMRSVFINPVYPGDKFYWYGVYANGGWGDQASLSMFMSPAFKIASQE